MKEIKTKTTNLPAELRQAGNTENTENLRADYLKVYVDILVINEFTKLF